MADILSKPLTTKESMDLMKKLAKSNKVRLTNKHFKPGAIISFGYNAKNQLDTFDKTPLAFILMRGKTHTLAINFHWAPIPMRVVLAKAIIMANFLDYSSFSMDRLENDLELMSEEFNLIVMAVDYDMAKDLNEVE